MKKMPGYNATLPGPLIRQVNSRIICDCQPGAQALLTTESGDATNTWFRVRCRVCKTVLFIVGYMTGRLADARGAGLCHMTFGDQSDGDQEESD